VLFAQGREPNSAGLTVERAGVAVQDGWISVNADFQTNVPHIYAVGDLIGRPALASTGMEQGRAAVLHAFSGEPHVTAENLPMAVYTIPEISYVGKTEQDVIKEGIPYVIGRAYFKDSARPDHRRRTRLAQAHRGCAQREVIGCAYRGRAGQRAGAYRATGDEPERHDARPDQQCVQLSDAGRVLQDRRAGLHPQSQVATTATAAVRLIRSPACRIG
jgi:hypothetical protein